ncbi:MAG: hypothetical protein V1798_05850 [Pseudomonadota bacterium]
MRWVLPVAVSILLSVPAHAQKIQTLEEESGGIRISFEVTGDESQVRQFKAHALPETRSILEALASDFGVGGASQAAIYFYSPETYHQKFPKTVDTRMGAFYDGKAVYARADNELTYDLRRTLRHELTHLVLAKNFGPLPAWLNEGLAVYEERQTAPDPVDRAPNSHEYNTIFINKQDKKTVPFDQLENSAIFNRSQGLIPAGDAYTTAYIAVYELIQKSGTDAMRQYLAAIGKGKNPRAELQVYFGIAYEKMNEFLAQIAAKKS